LQKEQRPLADQPVLPDLHLQHFSVVLEPHFADFTARALLFAFFSIHDQPLTLDLQALAHFVLPMNFGLVLLHSSDTLTVLET